MRLIIFFFDTLFDSKLSVRMVLFVTLAFFCIWNVAILEISAEEIQFKVHVLNLDSEFSAAAAMDVNRDGKLDVISGGFWYEAPTWKRHIVREVENIRGRFDDYSNLPLDVNQDGWLDLVSCNYRSNSLYWVENPKRFPGIWQKHLIDSPGPSETGRLEDIDGDGDLDVLPNGVKFAAWYELTHEQKEKIRIPQWKKHDLPKELVGHGIGFGDINGDGRSDLIGTSGWLEAPANRKQDEWKWHAEFTLDRDASVPIVVHDVDADGDQDLIWGRGHNFGIYWLRQDQAANGKRVWQKLEVDKSWSQPHSLLMADINGDGKLNLIAGKRYMGHDGKDPGEKDPLCVYWYEFDSKEKAWKRHTISEGGKVGMDLDPKAVDLDQDGDIDLIAPARSGLHWIENLRIN